MTWEQKMAASLLAGVVGAGLYKRYREQPLYEAVIPGVVAGVAIGTREWSLYWSRYIGPARRRSTEHHRQARR